MKKGAKRRTAELVAENLRTYMSLEGASVKGPWTSNDGATWIFVFTTGGGQEFEVAVKERSKP